MLMFSNRLASEWRYRNSRHSMMKMRKAQLKTHFSSKHTSRNTNMCPCGTFLDAIIVCFYSNVRLEKRLISFLIFFIFLYSSLLVSKRLFKTFWVSNNLNVYTLRSGTSPFLFGWWWLEPWNFLTFPSYWECHHPNWRTPWFFRGVGIPPTRMNIEGTHGDSKNIIGDQSCNESFWVRLLECSAVSPLSNQTWQLKIPPFWIIVVHCTIYLQYP